MNRFDIPETVTAMIKKGIEIELLDASDVLALGSTFGDDFTGLVSEIMSYAYSNIHHNEDHNVMAPFADSFHHWKSTQGQTSYVQEVPEEKEDDFDSRFELFYAGAVQKHDDYMTATFPGNRKDEFSFKRGKRYMKIIRGGSVHCFVDTTNGDVLKAASWSAPAKHARGNIFNDDNGVKCMQPYGACYLR